MSIRSYPFIENCGSVKVNKDGSIISYTESDR